MAQPLTLDSFLKDRLWLKNKLVVFLKMSGSFGGKKQDKAWEINENLLLEGWEVQKHLKACQGALKSC